MRKHSVGMARHRRNGGRTRQGIHTFWGVLLVAVVLWLGLLTVWQSRASSTPAALRASYIRATKGTNGVESEDLRLVQDHDDVSGVYALAARRVPSEDLDFLKFGLEPSRGNEDSYDHFRYTVDQAGQKIEIIGSSRTALAVGLRKLYATSCNVELLSWASRGTNPPSRNCLATALRSGSLITQLHHARVKFRYYLNQVTWSYSMAWWGFKRWEQELDWMALRGVNLALAHVGQEAIWLRVWRSFFAPQEFDWSDFLTSPAYLSWQRMGNLQALGHPVKEKWFALQLELQHAILKRMGELGIAPILPVFNLHVPRQLNVATEQSSYWSGFFNRYSGVHRLKPDSELADKISKMFVRAQLEEYAAELAKFQTHYYSVDIFNEMDAGDTNVGAAFQAVYDPVVACDNKAVLVVQMWAFAHSPEWTPSKVSEFIDAVPSNRVLYLDLHGEKRPQWRRIGKELSDKSVIWTLLHNFGGTKGMVGELAVVQHQVEAALDYGVKGIGLAMEAIEQNELEYDFALSLAWDSVSDVEAWVEQWALRRYWLEAGHPAASAVTQAWRCALRTAYARRQEYAGWGTTTSVVEQRPGPYVSYGSFQSPRLTYDPAAFKTCAMSLSSALAIGESELPGLQALSYDVVDMLRQVLSNTALELHKDHIRALSYGDDSLEVSSAHKLLQTIELLADILDTHWMWRTVLVDIDWSIVDQAQIEDFRTLFLGWSWQTEALDSYASRLAGDIVRQVHFPRWSVWLQSPIHSLKLETTYKDIERRWTQSKPLLDLSSGGTSKQNIKELLVLSKDALSAFGGDHGN